MKIATSSTTALLVFTLACAQIAASARSFLADGYAGRRKPVLESDDSLRPFTHHHHRRRTACGLYLWDAPSALLHKWCRLLMKDCTYEGRGGHRYVRVEPGSILQLLYPCSQYSPDRCLICGGCFRDHLTLWWSKHLYTPYDLYLDRTLRESLDDDNKDASTRDSRAKPKISNDFLAQNNNAPVRRHSFHRRYVNDVSPAATGNASTKRRQPVSQKSTHAREKQRTVGSVTYQLPVEERGSESANSVVRFVKEIVLTNLDFLIQLERLDFLIQLKAVSER